MSWLFFLFFGFPFQLPRAWRLGRFWVDRPPDDQRGSRVLCVPNLFRRGNKLTRQQRGPKANYGIKGRARVLFPARRTPVARYGMRTTYSSCQHHELESQVVRTSLEVGRIGYERGSGKAGDYLHKVSLRSTRCVQWSGSGHPISRHLHIQLVLARCWLPEVELAFGYP